MSRELAQTLDGAQPTDDAAVGITTITSAEVDTFSAMPLPADRMSLANIDPPALRTWDTGIPTTREAE